MSKLLAIFFISFGAHAFNIAQIAVIEAPIFEKPDTNSKVIQYLNKG